jgi:hypothetical protein
MGWNFIFYPLKERKKNRVYRILGQTLHAGMKIYKIGA